MRVIVPILLLSSVLPACASSCLSGTLATYIGLGSSGCGVFPGVSPFLTVKDFSFSSSALAGTPTLLTAAGITMTPSTTTHSFTLDVSAGFSAGTGDAASYVIGYTVDPPPPVIHGFRLSMRSFSPVAPGFASITTDLCLGAAFSGASCSTSTTSVTVFDDDISPVLTAFTLFPADSVVGVRNTIVVDASSGGTADFSSFGGETLIVPEPASGWIAGLGLALLTGWRWSRRRWGTGL